MDNLVASFIVPLKTLPSSVKTKQSRKLKSLESGIFNQPISTIRIPFVLFQIQNPIITLLNSLSLKIWLWILPSSCLYSSLCKINNKNLVFDQDTCNYLSFRVNSGSFETDSSVSVICRRHYWEEWNMTEPESSFVLQVIKPEPMLRFISL